MRQEATGQEQQDGRLRRGNIKRQQIIAAALCVIEHQGVAGITHRSVAEQAGLPPSAATYYFANINDLLLAALTAAADDYAVQLTALIHSGIDPIDGIAALIADASGPGRQRALAERELSLLATRQPLLRPIAKHWRTLVAQAAGQHSQDPLTIQSVVAAADGICACAMLQDEPISAAEVSQLLRHLLRPA